MLVIEGLFNILTWQNLQYKHVQFVCWHEWEANSMTEYSVQLWSQEKSVGTYGKPTLLIRVLGKNVEYFVGTYAKPSKLYITLFTGYREQIDFQHLWELE